MVEHLFQVNEFGSITNETRCSPVQKHKTNYGFYTSKIEVTKLSDRTVIIVSLRSDDGFGVCCSVSLDLSIINLFNNNHHHKKFETYFCGTEKDQVYGCTFETNSILSSEGLCIDDVITIMANISVKYITVPRFGDPSEISTIDWTTAPVNANLFQQEEYSDVRFQIGLGLDDEKDGQKDSNIFFGNRAILCISCPAMKALFFSKDKKNNNQTSTDPILVMETEMQSFMTIMRMIYCNEIIINPSFIRETLAAAEKFEVPELTFAVAFLLHLDHLPVVYNFSLSSEFNRFDILCAHVIRSNVTQFMSIDQFCQLNQAAVSAIVNDDELRIEESLLWNLCLEWATAECKRKGLQKPKQKDKRKVMRPFLHEFRLRSMGLVDFTRGPADSGILKLAEIVDVYRYYSSAIIPSYFKKEKRFGNSDVQLQQQQQKNSGANGSVDQEDVIVTHNHEGQTTENRKQKAVAHWLVLRSWDERRVDLS